MWSLSTITPHFFQIIILVYHRQNDVWRSVNFWTARNRRERDEEQRERPDGNANCSLGLVFFNNSALLQTKLIKPVILIYAAIGRSKVHLYYAFDGI